MGSLGRNEHHCSGGNDNEFSHGVNTSSCICFFSIRQPNNLYSDTVQLFRYDSMSSLT